MPRSLLALTLLVLAAAGPAFGQSGNVLGVVPEGVVIDAGSFPDLRPGARIGFHRPDGSAAQVGEGWVLEVREGRALVGLKPGGAVQAGDVAMPCPGLSGPASQDDLRASILGLKAQLASAGGGSPEVQATMSQLEAALDAREAAVRAGACDVGQQDQQIAALSLQLQQMLTGAPPSGPPPPPGVATTQEPVAGAPAPSPGVPPVGQDSTTLATALQLVQQLAQTAQSMGLVGGRGSSAGQPSGASFPSSDVSSPPPQALPNPEASAPAVTSPPSPPIAETPPSPPTVATPAPPPVTDTPVAAPPPRVTRPAPGSPPPSGQPAAGRPPAVRQPGPGGWWTITPPKTSAPVVDALPGSSSGSSGSDSTKPPIPRTTPPPALKLPPQSGAPTHPAGAKQPDTGPTARVTPPAQRMAIVQGVIRAENGAPVPGAIILVGGKQVATNAQGLFLVGEVPLGSQTLVVTARGFIQGKVALELTSGEVEKVTLTLRRAPASAPAQIPR
jgi:Carboxypeptidase regulatory-like domain